MGGNHRATYNELAKIKKEIWKLESKVEEQHQLIKQCQEIIDDSGTNPETEAVLAELPGMVAEDEKSIADLRAKQAELEATLPPKPEAPGPKYDPAQHPILKKALESNQPAKPVVYNTGDIVEALWTDKQWYKAKINMIMGSSAAPKYNVRFLDYKNETLTVDRDAIRPPVVETKKRKADGPPAQSSAPASSLVISGPATVNPDAQAKKDATKIPDGPPQNKRRIGGEKALERKKSNWQNFVTKGPGKKTQKESQFRSSGAVNSKVGFTGSGAGMTATQKRVRPSYKPGPEDY